MANAGMRGLPIAPLVLCALARVRTPHAGNGRIWKGMSKVMDLRSAGISQRLRPLNVQAGLIERSFSLRRRVAFGVHQSTCKSDLELDLVSAHDCRARQGRDLG
jgi:hypothetical protein